MNDLQKQAAAEASVRFVKDGDVVGLGTGSTASLAVRLLGERVKQGLKIRGIPTSSKTRDLAQSLRIPLTTLEEVQVIDITIDGADEFDPNFNLIKGGGGAMLREKIIASASTQLIIVADASKQVSRLGKFPLPLEVITFAQALIANRVVALGAEVKQRATASGEPYLTDEGHHILDCHFGEIPDPPALARQLSDMPGIVEHGLFIGMASLIILAKESGVEEMGPLKGR